MAWLQQCKFEAVQQVDHKIENGLSVREALKAVSAECDIPQGTLKRWKYPEKSVPKNGNKPKAPPTHKSVFKTVVKRADGILDYIEKNLPCDDDCKVRTKLAVAYILFHKVWGDAANKGLSGEEIQEILSGFKPGGNDGHNNVEAFTLDFPDNDCEA